MTRTDFERIAFIIRGIPEAHRYSAAMEFARELAKQFPRFNKSKFLSAAIGTPECDWDAAIAAAIGPDGFRKGTP